MADISFLRHLWESQYSFQKRLVWPFGCDETTRACINHSGSVSAFLVAQYGGQVVVSDVQSEKISITREERALIGCSRYPCRIREVELSTSGVTRVLARTVMEAQDVCLPISQSMLHDYSSPIGYLLYSDQCTRSTIVGFKSYVSADMSGVGRRRVIYYRDYRLCVTEFFPVVGMT